MHTINRLIHLNPNKIMKKQYAQMLKIASMLLLLVGSIMSCKQKGDAPPKEIVEAAEEASRQVPEQGPTPPCRRKWIASISRP